MLTAHVHEAPPPESTAVRMSAYEMTDRKRSQPQTTTIPDVNSPSETGLNDLKTLEQLWF